MAFFAHADARSRERHRAEWRRARCPRPLSLASGFYDGGETVALDAEAGATIRYTLDGSEPTEASTVYAGRWPSPRRRCSGRRRSRRRLASEPRRHADVLRGRDEHAAGDLARDRPGGLLQRQDGIYVEGTNGIPGRCRTFPSTGIRTGSGRCTSRFFEPDGAGGFERVLDQGAGVQIFGGCSRIYPQKSLSLHARSRYGASDFGYRFFPDVDIDSFDDLVLRSSAQDWWRTMFRDGMIQTSPGTWISTGRRTGPPSSS